MQIKTTSHASEIAVEDGVELKYPFLSCVKTCYRLWVHTVEYTFRTGESILKVRMIANVSFREIVILLSDVFVKSSLAFIAFSMFYFFNAVKRNLRIQGRF